MEATLVQGSEAELEWKRLLEATPGAPPQLSLEWRDAVIAAYPRLESAYYLAGKQASYSLGFASIYCGSLLFGDRAISLPFCDYGGFVGDGATSYEDVSTLFSHLRSRFSTDKIEVRLSAVSPHSSAWDRQLLGYGFAKQSQRHTAVLDLSAGEKLVWEGFSRHVRKNVNKAERSGLAVKEVNSQKEIDAFYREYLFSMKRFGTPPHSKKFFEQLYSRLGAGKNFFCFNCYYGEAFAGSLLMMRQGEVVSLPYGVSPPAFREYRPNDLLHWAAMRKAIEIGARHFDLGLAQADAPVGSHAAGILDFKLKLGCKLFERPSYSFGGAPRATSMKGGAFRKLFSSAWSVLPVSLTEKIGPWIRARSCV